MYELPDVVKKVRLFSSGHAVRAVYLGLLVMVRTASVKVVSHIPTVLELFYNQYSGWIYKCVAEQG